MFAVRMDIHLLHPMRAGNPLVQMSGSFGIRIKLLDISFLENIFACFNDRSFDLIKPLQKSKFDDAALIS